jgi:hypothetical protein
MKAGVKTKNVLLSLIQQPNGECITSQTLYNAKQKERNDSLSGLTQIQYLVKELEESNWVSDYKLSEESNLQAVFFAHPDSIKLCRSYNLAIVMDCTYKTNKYKMSLLNVVGITSINSTFYICFAFLPQEIEQWYSWALTRLKALYEDTEVPKAISIDRDLALFNAINDVFPLSKIILCTWHINGNIAKNLKGKVEAFVSWKEFLEDWNKVMYASEEDEFLESWAAMIFKYGIFSEVINYLGNTWIPLKENFVACWINKFPHLGGHTSSRVEGAHAALKSYMNLSTGDLLIAKENIERAIIKQMRDYQATTISEKTRSLHPLNNSFFANVLRRVSYFSLKKIEKEYEKAIDSENTPPGRCLSYNSLVMGIPCSHLIRNLIKNREVLNLYHISSQWYLDRPLVHDLNQDVLYTHIRDPLVSQPRGRPHESSRAERFNLRETTPRIRHCGMCGESGHNSRTCSLRDIERN